ncbi:tRNA preQ1(34) S-adenosylmethionine ribosyltransferase-isomerase QueA [Candidatus Saccharibacteria bacterium]|nr:tRNA preQ1(34) S-adenosylmethionine ribosyltransferase-isomerase QueA [Candidatus Saccharibacteria bacterium]
MEELKKYYFDLPDSLIAQKPAHPRDHARLLVYSLNDCSITDTYFHELPKYLPLESTLVLNNSKVEHCRWLFDDGKTEIFVLEKTDSHTVRAMVRPGRKFSIDSRVKLTAWLQASVLAIDEGGVRTLRMNVGHDDPRLKIYEHVPLPPYIKQDKSLANDYQTVYAKPVGSLAAPTAGLHFTNKLLSRISTNHNVTEITLHVGLGTFAKLTKEQFKIGKLHEEYYSISEQTAAVLNKARHLTAVGTTTVRTLESAADSKGIFNPMTSYTDIFIQPGYRFKVINSLITNFHLPSTSLLMLTASFIADKLEMTENQAVTELQSIYAHAIANKYRFYSFGDAMIIV